MIAVGIVIVACTSSVETMLGSRWRRRITPSPAPLATAALTNSCSRSASASPRVTRMSPGMAAIPSASVALSSDGPRMAARPTASTRKGNASSTSVKREMTGSHQPRK